MPHRCATWFALAGLLCTLTVGNAAAQESLTVGAQDDGEGTDILGAFGDSFKLLLIEHAWRIGLQEKTRADDTRFTEPRPGTSGSITIPRLPGSSA